MESEATNISAGAKWGGLALSIIPSLMLTLSGVMKFVQPTGFEEGLALMGYRADQMYALGVVELLCVAIYWIPRTSVVGAILLTGYMGGAIATHYRVGDLFIIQVLIGMAFWGGLYLRNERLRELIPFKRSW
ncbi:MAG: DoxX family protein [Acidobacteriota bacterium]|nr:MAG: DoxX family protein [Acidobacteriota bacterium]